MRAFDFIALIASILGLIFYILIIIGLIQYIF